MLTFEGSQVQGAQAIVEKLTVSLLNILLDQNNETES